MVKKTPAALKSQDGRWVLSGEISSTRSDNAPNAICDASTPQTLMRHPQFFFDNVLVAIQIENTLFNVHKYQLAKSEVFSDMFNLPKPEGHEPEEGSSPEHPIIIGGVTASDFSALLTVLYASYFSSNQPAPEAALVIPAFRLANMFNFSDLRAYLLPLAEKNLGDVDKIVFAKEFDIKEWLAPAYVRICKQEAVLGIDEARKLDVDSVLFLWRTREQHRGRSSAMIHNQYYCSSCTGISYHDYANGVCKNCSHNSSKLYCSGSGSMWANTNVDDSALEAEVKKWMEDSFAAKG